MGVITDRGKGKIEIIYGGLESPISGIDASKINGAFIKPNALQVCSGVAANQGYLTRFFQNHVQTATIANPEGPFLASQVTLANVNPSVHSLITRQSISYIIFYNNDSKLTIYEWLGPVGFGVPTVLTIALATSDSIPTTLTSYIVNGIVYITGEGLGAIYAYTPIGNGNSTLTTLTTYLGALYLGELNGRLIALAVQKYDSGSGTWSYYPYQIAWSAAQGNYGQWNPLVGGLVTGAGYNNLPDVQDELVGFITTGPTGYALRRQGITELSPLNSGIEPFDFNHLWASNKGIGSIFPNTISQYGSLGAFLSDTGIYTLGYNGLDRIDGDYWDSIISQVTAYANASGGVDTTYEGIRGQLSPLTIAQDTFLAYALCVDTSLNIGKVLDKTWFHITLANVAEASSYRLIAAANAMFNLGGSGLSTLVLAAFSDSETVNFYNFIDFNVNVPMMHGQVVFPIEEVSMFKDITINAIGIYADTTGYTSAGATNITFIVTGLDGPVPFTPVNIVPGTKFYLTYPQNTGFCQKYPQLSFSTNDAGTTDNSFSIYKIVLFCTVDMAQVP